MEITDAHTDDIEPLADCWVDLARNQRQHGSHLRAESNRSAIRETIAERVVSDDALLARDDSAIIGFVMFTVEYGSFDQDASRGTIEALFVRPSHRSEGIGGRLLSRAERRLREAGVEAVGVETMATNLDARRFYRRYGYEPHRIAFEKRVDTNRSSDGDSP